MRLEGYGGKQSETCRATTAQPWVNFTRLREDSKWPKHERFVSTVNRYRRREGICKDNRRIQGERHLWETMVSATPSSSLPKPAWQSKTRFQCGIKVQRRMPKRKATGRN